MTLRKNTATDRPLFVANANQVKRQTLQKKDKKPIQRVEVGAAELANNFMDDKRA